MPNKGEEEGKKRKLMAWLEVYGDQRNLAFKIVSLNCFSFFVKQRNVFLPHPNVAFQLPTKRRDELVHRILNDIFREKVACLRSGRGLTRLRQSMVPLRGQTQLCGGP